METNEGLYSPTQDEIWHRHEDYVSLQDRLIDALRALEHSKNNP